MLDEYKTKTNVYIGIGLILQLFSWPIGAILGELVVPFVQFGGAILVIIGCCYYAKGKGYHGAWGLLGLLSIFGLLVLVFMRDKYRQGAAKGKICVENESVIKGECSSGIYCPRCGKYNDKAYSFCYSCGNKLPIEHENDEEREIELTSVGRVQTPPPVVDAEEMPKPESAQAEDKKPFTIDEHIGAIIVGGIIFLMIIVGLLAMLK